MERNLIVITKIKEDNHSYLRLIESMLLDNEFDKEHKYLKTVKEYFIKFNEITEAQKKVIELIYSSTKI